MYVCESNNEEGQFNMIVIEDLLNELEIKLDYYIESITWHSIIRPIRSMHTLEDILHYIRDKICILKHLKSY